MTDSKISLFGLGQVGELWVRVLTNAGYDVSVWARDPGQIRAAADNGAEVSASIVDNILSSSTIISTLPNQLALQEIFFDELWAHELEGRTIIHMGSLSASRSRAFHDAFSAHGAYYIEAPLIGKASAEQQQLLVACDSDHYLPYLPLLQNLASQVTFVGVIGQAETMKLAHSQIMLSQMGAFSVALGLLQSESVSSEDFLNLLSYGPYFAPMFELNSAKLLQRDYSDSTSQIKNILEDVKQCLDMVEEHEINAPHLENLKDLMSFAILKGNLNTDLSSLHDVIFPPRS